MDRKRARSMNWDEEEKQLLRAVLKDHAEIIENKSLDTNSNKTKCKAWEEVHKRFNELNVRNRQLSQLKMQWKAMKMYARKTCSSFTKECNETGGGARPRTPDNTYMEIKDLLNPAELLKDENIYDSDGIIPISDNKLVATPSETAVTLQEPVTYLLTPLESSLINDNIMKETEINNNICTRDNIEVQIVQEVTPILSSQDGGMTKNVRKSPAKTSQENPLATPIKKRVSTPTKVLKRKFTQNSNVGDVLTSRKEHDDYVSKMLCHSKQLKEIHHKRTMEMAEEEHAIKMEILKENLKSAILEREILELKKKEMSNK